MTDETSGGGPALTIATRGSALARWQADLVASMLPGAAPLLIVDTTADTRLDVPIWEMGGKGVFVKEVQAAVLDGRARLTVHSGKDLPAITHEDLVVAAVPERGDPRDALVGATLEGLAPGSVVATGSVRRRAQLASLRPDLTFAGLRGNIATRLQKVPAGGAIVMAAAAIERLGLGDELGAGPGFEVLAPSVMLPQVAQGTLAVECRADDVEARVLLAELDHAPTRLAFEAERAFLRELGGDCDLPAGAYARVLDGSDPGTPTIVIDALLASLDGHVVLRASHTGADADQVGRAVARHLLDDAGGRALLDR